MSKIKLLSLAVIGLLVINIGILLFLFLRKPIHPAEGRPMQGAGAPKNIIIERLNFDKEQVVQYEKLIHLHQQSVKELNGQIRDTKNQLYSTLASDAVSSKDSLENKLGDLQKQIESVHYNHFEKIKKLCKPEQIEKFNSLTLELAKYFAPGRNSQPPPKD